MSRGLWTFTKREQCFRLEMYVPGSLAVDLPIQNPDDTGCWIPCSERRTVGSGPRVDLVVSLES